MKSAEFIVRILKEDIQKKSMEPHYFLKSYSICRDFVL